MPQGSRVPQGGGRFPSMRGALMVDTVRGSIRVRSWPKPRPGPRHPSNEYWTKWLRAVTYLYRYQPAEWQWQLQAATKGTVWMPRDVFIAAIRGRAFLPQDELGRTWFPMAVIQDVSESLDALGQFPGMMLMRGEFLWQPIQPGSAGQFLQYVSDNDPAEWVDGPSNLYQALMLHSSDDVFDTFGVNSTSYASFKPLKFSFSGEDFPANQFRLVMEAASNAVGQTIKVQLATAAAPATALGVTGDNLTLTSTQSRWDSGWIDLQTPLSGWMNLCLAMKGSNSTVDIDIYTAECHLRID